MQLRSPEGKPQTQLAEAEMAPSGPGPAGPAPAGTVWAAPGGASWPGGAAAERMGSGRALASASLCPGLPQPQARAASGCAEAGASAGCRPCAWEKGPLLRGEERSGTSGPASRTGLSAGLGVRVQAGQPQAPAGTQPSVRAASGLLHRRGPSSLGRGEEGGGGSRAGRQGCHWWEQ